MPTHNPQVRYTGEIRQDGWLQRFFAFEHGCQVRTYYTKPAPPWMPQTWTEHEPVRVTLTEEQLYSELEKHADRADTLLVLGRTIATIRRLRREARELTLGPSEYTVVAMPEASL